MYRTSLLLIVLVLYVLSVGYAYRQGEEAHRVMYGKLIATTQELYYHYGYNDALHSKR